jgi:hypothetical protein
MSVDGIWYVKLADGDVERVTLDQLDEAFQKGQIDENSMVLADGANQWTSLGALLGASEVSPAVATTPAARPAAAVPMSAPARAPVAMRHPSPAGQPIAMMRPPGVPAFAPVASSLRPVSVDLSDQLDLPDLRYPTPSRKRWVVGVIGAVLALGAGAFVAVRQANMHQADAPTAPTFAAAAAVQFPSPVTPPPVLAPPPAPSPAQAGAPPANHAERSSVMDPTQSQRSLTEDQKKKLLEADKKVTSHHQGGRTAGGGGGGGGGGHREKSTGFTTGGNKFDPLNASF